MNDDPAGLLPPLTELRDGDLHQDDEKKYFPTWLRDELQTYVDRTEVVRKHLGLLNPAFTQSTWNTFLKGIHNNTEKQIIESVTGQIPDERPIQGIAWKKKEISSFLEKGEYAARVLKENDMDNSANHALMRLEDMVQKGILTEKEMIKKHLEMLRQACSDAQSSVC